MEIWESLEDWQKLLIGAGGSYVIYYLIFRATQSARDSATRFFNASFDEKQHELPHYMAVVSDGEIRVTRPDRSADSIELSTLSRVFVVTNDGGAWDYDVWFVLEGSKNILEFPLETYGSDEVLKLLKQLPGFELRGMNSTSNARYECWPNSQAEPIYS
ncbi:MAG: hypothetical protein K1X51_07565 [Rhodospirillaceae bacterium]|nr:hypothetical protein [Rhodospirillaceae bacterium]